MTPLLTRRWAAAALLAAAAAGCSGGPKLRQVTGRVTFDGRPLTYGHVVFFPPTANPEGDHSATGFFGPDGSYRLSTFNPNDGVEPGKYQVAVRSYHPPPPGAGPSAPLVLDIPERFSYSDKSGLTAEVTYDWYQTINFDLRSD